MTFLNQRTITLLNSVLMASFYFPAGTCETKSFYEYLSSYEMAECQVVKYKNKRSVNSMRSEDMNLDRTIEIKLKSASKTFNLLLFEDKLFNNISFSSSLASEDRIGKNSFTRFYEGVLKDKPLRTSVIGYLHGGTFCGTVFEENATYFIQPFKLLKPIATFSNKVVIYKSENLNLPFENNSSEFLSRISNVTINSTIIREGISFENKTSDLFCEIEIVADHTLYQFFKEDSDQLSAYLYLHAKHADKIFRKTDFNMDGKPDGIRISVAGMYIYKAANDSNYPMISAVTLSDYLTKFVTRKQEPQFCLSISMSYRSFRGSTIGEAFRPDMTYPNIAGGICEQTLTDQDENRVNFNVAAINLRLEEKPLLPLAVTLLAFTHEIGHGFGSDHDDPMYKPCSPDRPIGKYLMHPKTLPANEQRPEFSPCSRRAMRGVLRERGGCLKPKTPTCGNGIKEDSEECDCGWTAICDSIDPCCNPSDVQFPAIGCTFKGNDSECSHKESDCCTENCTVNTDTETLCYSGTSKCIASYCDGIDPECPVPKENLMDYSCSLKPLTCKDGACNESVCALKNREECNCTHNILQECLICCRTDEGCVPASDVGILNPAGGKYVRRRGTPCSFGIYHCDAGGRCVDPNIVEKPAKRKRSVVLVIFLSLLAVIATGIFFLVLYKSASAINLENLLLLRNHI
ncbi:Disintegrin and metalloproteinase domain-containing protein 10 [Araneus ventricosus]|uniref:Disintegrin and metalloproteinase domain-containing protein 10 n=1 Tax=Araneus ventricosus TaxID=182803 RepID=A0A4Y2EXW0_ARAVE|nr:Disintegrin and metalloproteinase domain-containing protein 10 [Araneus ventricosus]